MGGCCDGEIRYTGITKGRTSTRNQLEKKEDINISDHTDKKSEKSEEDEEGFRSSHNSSPVILDASKKKYLIRYIDLCRKQKKYSQLIELISNNTEIINPKAYIPWGEKPRTIGSLVIVYLCEICNKDPDNVISLVTPILPQLINNLNDGTEDIRDGTLMLLYKYLDHAPESAIINLIELNIFSMLMRSIMCSKEELRHLTSGVCCKIYKGRPYAQKIFFDMNGARQLMQLISWSSENDYVLRNLLEYLAELLQDNDDSVMKEYIAKLNREKATDILMNIGSSDKSAETLEIIDYLVSMLLSEETKE